MVRSLFVATLALTSGACALGATRGGDAGAPPTDAGAVDSGEPTMDAAADAGPSGVDAGPSGVDGGPSGVDGGPSGVDGGPPGVDAGGGADAGALSSELGLPDPSGAVCTTPGSLGECPGIAVCRFFSPEEGRCETCEPCGNLNAPCAASSECDILFMCFRGRCTNFCTLGTFECGAADDCVDVGHPTRGVCRP